MRIAFAERNRHLGDPRFMTVSLDTLLSPGYLNALAARLPQSPPGDSSVLMPAGLRESGSTTHVAVMDGRGGAVSLTYTLNANFGCKWVIPGTGILLNNQMDDFDARPGEPNYYGLIGTGVNQVRPGARMLSSMSPLIVLERGQPWIVLGSRGGPRILSSVLQVLLRRIADGSDLAAAVAAPRIHHQWLPDTVWFEEVATDTTLRDALEAMGYGISTRHNVGRVFAAERLAGGRFQGVRDPRANGLAVPVTLEKMP
jgi:gamma-glutamyltranspeptidase/glutathione hydrolase